MGITLTVEIQDDAIFISHDGSSGVEYRWDFLEGVNRRTKLNSAIEEYTYMYMEEDLEG